MLMGDGTNDAAKNAINKPQDKREAGDKKASATNKKAEGPKKRTSKA